MSSPPPATTHLGLRIEGAVEVRLVFLCEAFAANRVGIVVFKNAAGGVQGAVNVVLCAQVRHVHGADDVGSKGLLLIGLAPVDIWHPRDSRGINHVRGIVPVGGQGR